MEKLLTTAKRRLGINQMQVTALTYALRILKDETLYQHIPNETEQFVCSKMSAPHMAQLESDCMIEPCPAPRSGGKASTVLEHVAAAKERYRVIGDMLHTNLHGPEVPPIQFEQMHTWIKIAATLGAAWQNPWSAEIDMEKFYYQFELAPKIRRYFTFFNDGKWWQWKVLPMGVTSACFVANTVTRILVAIAETYCTISSAATSDVYIDNVGYAGNEDRVKEFVANFKNVALSHNVTIGEITVGSTNSHRGVEIDYQNQTAILKHTFRTKFDRRCSMMLQKPTQDRLESLLSMIIYAESIMPRGISTMKPYVHALRLLTALKRVDRPGNSRIDLGFCVENEITKWRSWMKMATPQSTVSRTGSGRDVMIATDASKVGFGMSIIMGNRIISYGERWRPAESRLHINVLELMAANRALHMFANGIETLGGPESAGSRILWLADNTTAIAVVLRRISRTFALHDEAEAMLDLAARMRWSIQPVWVASALNPADRPSRECTGWSSSHSSKPII